MVLITVVFFLRHLNHSHLVMAMVMVMVMAMNIFLAALQGHY
ncbi:hypothetical protein [Escherichia coli]|nr:hypothetical protein [Escherichia coli]